MVNLLKALPERIGSMKILYGIQGTGNGHVSRATQIIRQLRNLGAQVDVIFSGCNEDKVYDTSVIHSPVFFKGFTFCVKNGGIRLFNTLQHLSLRRFIRDVSNFDPKSYDLVITDFEPVSAWIARKANRPCIGIGHQYAFLHNIPMDRSNPLAKLIIKYFAPADISIGMHWHHFGQPIVPPVIPPGITVSDTVDDSFILVYLPFENKEHIRDLLSSFKNFRFAVYAQNSGEEIKEEANIRWHPFSKTLFIKDLTICAGVISNAGFELPSEALSLGKKILVKPLKGQFEQISNAMALTLLDLGVSMASLDKHCVENWLIKTKTAKRKYPDVAGHIAGWIMKGDFSSTNRLVEETWQAA